jgi:hypothetical protein
MGGFEEKLAFGEDGAVGLGRVDVRQQGGEVVADDIGVEAA